MKKFPKPWYRPSRGVWFVTLDGKQINLGPDREAEFQQYAQLLAAPRIREVPAGSLVAVIDAFLDWVQKHRAADTYEWYRYRLERFAQLHPDMRLGDLKPYHAQRWIDSYPQLLRTTKRNYLRTIKRCCKWAVQQGYLTNDPLQHLELPSGRPSRNVDHCGGLRAIALIDPQRRFSRFDYRHLGDGVSPARVVARRVASSRLEPAALGLPEGRGQGKAGAAGGLFVRRGGRHHPPATGPISNRSAVSKFVRASLDNRRRVLPV